MTTAMPTSSSVPDGTSDIGEQILEIVRKIGPTLAMRASAFDAEDTFVAENYTELRQHRLLSAAVPTELGGLGASVPELGAMLREMAHYCSSTALALSMHTHQVAMAAWRWQRERAPALENLLRRVADEQIVIVSAGANDWLDSSGTLHKVEGGYLYSGRKGFASGSPAGAIIMASGVYDDPAEGLVVLHFGLPLNAPGVTVLDNWRALGMRGTGSNDIVIEDAFIPDAAISLRRTKGKWAPIYHLVAMIALPLVYNVYVGIAEQARDVALALAAKRREQPEVQSLAGDMETELRTAQMVIESALQNAESGIPGPETTSEALIRRTIAGQSAMRAVSRAMDVAGGTAFHRSSGLERLWRDVQGARFHPLMEEQQHILSGRLALGLPIDRDS